MSAYSIDATDIRILNAFIEHGAMSNVQLSNRVHLSESACHHRVSSMKKAGILKGFVADIDYRAVAKPIFVLTLIVLETQNTTRFTRFADDVEREPFIMRAYRVTGAYDYALMSVAPTFEDYHEAILRVVNGGSGVKEYYSHIMHQVVKEQSPALDHLIDLPSR